jgi:hypothetical protein
MSLTRCFVWASSCLVFAAWPLSLAQDVTYVLEEGSQIFHHKNVNNIWERANRELRGTFVGFMYQFKDRIELSMLDINFKSVDGEYTLEGMGDLMISFWRRWDPLVGLRVAINGVDGYELGTCWLGDCINYGGEQWPRVSFTVYQSNGPLSRELESFTVTVKAVATDAKILFLRGDFDGGGRIDISDAVAMLSFFFGEGDAPSCVDAADANDDGSLDIADPIALLGSLFLGQGPLRAPAWTCGIDTTLDTLDCDGQVSCLPVR